MYSTLYMLASEPTLLPACRENTAKDDTCDTVGARESTVGDDYVAMETNPAYIANEQV